MSDPASPVQVECRALMMGVDIVCFQELSEFWRQYVSKMCLNVGLDDVQRRDDARLDRHPHICSRKRDCSFYLLLPGTS